MELSAPATECSPWHFLSVFPGGAKMKFPRQLVRSCRALTTVCVGAAALVLACANPDQPTAPGGDAASAAKAAPQPLTSVSFDVEYTPGNPGKGPKSETFHIDRKRGRRGGWNTTMLLPLQSISA